MKQVKYERASQYDNENRRGIKKTIEYMDEKGNVIKSGVRYYYVTKQGKIYPIGTTRIKPISESRNENNGYMKVFNTTTHRLTAFAWGKIASMDSVMDIDHKDGNKLNNNVDNLQALTHKENTIKRSNDPQNIKAKIWGSVSTAPDHNGMKSTFWIDKDYPLPTVAEFIRQVKDLAPALNASQIAMASKKVKADIKLDEENNRLVLTKDLYIRGRGYNALIHISTYDDDSFVVDLWKAEDILVYNWSDIAMVNSYSYTDLERYIAETNSDPQSIYDDAKRHRVESVGEYNIYDLNAVRIAIKA